MNVRKTDDFIADVERQFEWYVANAGSEVADRYLDTNLPPAPPARNTSPLVCNTPVTGSEQNRLSKTPMISKVLKTGPQSQPMLMRL